MSFDTGASDLSDGELEKFLNVEKVKTQFHEQVHRITDICWDKCIDKIGPKIDGKSHACMVNCVERFIDSTMLLTKRFATMLQSHAGAM